MNCRTIGEHHRHSQHHHHLGSGMVNLLNLDHQKCNLLYLLPQTKYTIFEMLNLSPSRVFCIETDPIRKNILCIFHYIDKDQSMKKVFRPIIEEVKQNKENTTKTMFFLPNQKTVLSSLFYI